jgi:hypothetical protein
MSYPADGFAGISVCAATDNSLLSVATTNSKTPVVITITPRTGNKAFLNILFSPWIELRAALYTGTNGSGYHGLYYQ